MTDYPVRPGRLDQQIGVVRNGKVYMDAAFVRDWNNLLSRVGGQHADRVGEALTVANQAASDAAIAVPAALAAADTSGATPDVLVPAAPASAVSAGLYNIVASVAAHTRNATPYSAGAVITSSLLRGVTYYVYVDSGGDYRATTDQSIANDVSGGNLYLNSVYVASYVPPTSGGGSGGGVLP